MTDFEILRRDWLDHLAHERRLSPKTLEAYGRDLAQFASFLDGHLGGVPGLADIAGLKPVDLRAFLGQRRRDGVGNRTLMRQLAALRSFARFGERTGKLTAAAFAATRGPRIGKSLPRPLDARAAKAVTQADTRAGEEREAWILARDAAVLALLYGCGLRISEALSLSRAQAPKSAGDTLTVIGKGQKTRMVPVLPVVVSAVAFPPPFLRDPSARARRRFARHPGTARPCLALDDADLYADRFNPVDGGL
jgi:integrase/recombinase XerC